MTTLVPPPSGRPAWVAHQWRAMNMVLTAPATSGGAAHDFESGTAITASLAVMALRDAPLATEPALRSPTKEN